MKSILLLSGCLLAIINNGFTQAGHRVIGIGFYNVENFFHPDNDSTKNDEDFTPDGSYHYSMEVYQQKMANVAKVFNELGTDVTPDGAAIIGIAEIESDLVLRDLVKHPTIAARNYRYVWFPTPDVRGISTAMLYNPKYFRLINAQPVQIPLEKVGQNRPTRAITYAKGLLVGNDTIHVMVNHWPSRSGGVAETNPYRELAAAVCKQLADSIFQSNPESKIFIMGDLNDNPIDPSIKKVMKAKADTTNLASTDIYNPWINVFKKGTGTEIFDNQWNLLDQIMVSGSLFTNANQKWRYYKNRIFRKDYLVHASGPEQGHPHRSFTIDRSWDNGFSDHLPVIVYLVL